MFHERPYQIALIKTICTDLEAAARRRGAVDPVVLASAPASGKTVMSIAVSARLLKAAAKAGGPFKRILVLAHGTLVILSNYVEELRDVGAAVGIKADAWHAYRPGDDLVKLSHKIIVSLPQSLCRLSADEFPKFDLVIVDEAHHYYHEPMVQGIVEKCGARAVLCLTGTPSPFVARGCKTIRTLSLADLYKAGHVADPYVQMAVSDFDFTMADYDGAAGAKELKKGTTTPKTARARAKFNRQIVSTFDRMLGDLARAMADARGFALRERSERQDWGRLLDANNKTMIVCHSQAMAKAARDYFEARGIRALLSISEVEDSTEEIHRFKDERLGERLLIVVNRGGLGFDYPRMMTLVDMTGTLNPDRIFQMICRVVRRHPNGARADRGKMYFKVCSPQTAGIADLWVHAALMLAGDDMIKKWNGEDLDGVAIVAPVGSSLTRDQQKLLAIYKETGARVSPTHPLADVESEAFESPEFQRVAKKLIRRHIAEPDKEREAKTPEAPPVGFLMFEGHFVPRVERGDMRAGKKSVRAYAETTLGRALVSLGARRETGEEYWLARIQEQREYIRAHGDPSKSDDPNARRVCAWLRKIAAEAKRRSPNFRSAVWA